MADADQDAPPNDKAPADSEAREARLAAALRANLRRRKRGPPSPGPREEDR